LAENPELVLGKDVLELGCGLGFPAMVASHLGGRVLATDFHPDVEFYFQRNCRHSSQQIAYRRFNWREGAEDVGLFDVVMGSDILYESKHAHEVVEGLTRFLRPGGVILLADPGRAYLGKFLEGMKSAGFEGKMGPGTGAQVHTFRRSST
jgi:predicted nicotinamide N-methyase